MIKNRIKEYRARFDMKQEDLARQESGERLLEIWKKENIIRLLYWHGTLQKLLV